MLTYPEPLVKLVKDLIEGTYSSFWELKRDIADLTVKNLQN